MITYKCDQCGDEVTPDHLHEVELILAPHDLEGAVNYDAEERLSFGQVCSKCAKVVETRLRRLLKELAA